jgi:L-threonylcarbamoyladenylate synthase
VTAAILPLGGKDDEEAHRRAELVLYRGGLISFPTDTFYALGADPYNAGALASLYRLKGRPPEKPILLLIGEQSWAEDLWEGINPRLEALMDRFWPGPLTIVAKASSGAPALPGTGGLALRVPGNPLTCSLLTRLGRPVTGTSANPAGREAPRSAAAVDGYFPRGVDLILDGGTYQGRGESSIVEIKPEGWEIIREGAVPAFKILELLS